MRIWLAKWRNDRIQAFVDKPTFSDEHWHGNFLGELSKSLCPELTIENKELLLRDLCARLPYDVKVAFFNEDLTHHSEPKTLIGIECINNLNYSRLEDEDGNTTIVEFVKPYLFPLSSMTEEQWNNAPTMGLTNFTFESFKCKCFTLASYTCENDLHDLLEFINWLIANHFDVYGLIPKGLALDATGLNIY